MIWQFATRYFWAKKSTNAINIIAWISVCAIAVGTAALFIILSVFNGFSELVASLYSSFYPSVKVMPAQGKQIYLEPSTLRKIQALPGVVHFSEVIEEKAVLSYNNEPTIAILKGVDSNYIYVSGVKDKIVRGKYETMVEGMPEGVFGSDLEGAMGIDMTRSDIPVTVYVPRPGAGATALPEEALNSDVLFPAGAFAIQQDFNTQYVITHIDFLRRLLSMQPGQMSALEISIRPHASDRDVQKSLQLMLGNKFVVQTRFEQNQSLFAIMQTEKWVVYLILSFVLVIAAFNMIGSLSMLVIEKQKDVTILKAMGANDPLILRIFLAEGLLIAGFGALIGFILGFTICVLQQRYGILKLGGTSFLVDSFPVSMHFQDFLLILMTILGIGLAASWYPARRAARQSIELKAS
ncbi:lipoprotein-releasing system permease protein [Chitinophaga costaii]|uniref:Lipoprotein-releasing system permease protein n=1 Tax=Chitinophaga costaii TaxID=1335309 RepID=A0A1C4DSK2_9BACT|nr:FtsX-like permease family protein [Chitinophaga costaii]PUZ27768.1 ABC transporter permease [Chitinophaga costaii]SCC34230.1 lipoprotein-releasing system permease protein [Chitinophaga costaii]